MRRFTRLTDAFSKKFKNHCHMVALYAAWYNFVRTHKTFKVTPAMEAGITDRLRSLADAVEIVEELGSQSEGPDTATQMNYPDGTKVIIGDRLTLWEGCHGTVVCSIDDAQYTPEYPEEHWAYLGMGVLIDSNQGGLIHYTEPEDSFKLIARKSN